MTMRNLGIGAALLALAGVTASMNLAPARAQEPAIEPEATRLLMRMTDYLGSVDRFSVDTDNMLEDVLASGQKIQYDFTSDIHIQRPDKLRVERTGDLLEQLLIYDSESLTIHDIGEGYWASVEAPSNLDDLLHFARDTLDIVPPTGDFVFTNAFDLLMGSVVEGFVVGKSMVGGVVCDHLAFRTPLVDWQVWIADGDEPLPYKYVLTTMDDPAHPQFLVLMSNWNVEPDFDAGSFELAVPNDAQEVEFLHMKAGQWTID